MPRVSRKDWKIPRSWLASIYIQHHIQTASTAKDENYRAACSAFHIHIASYTHRLHSAQRCKIIMHLTIIMPLTEVASAVHPSRALCSNMNYHTAPNPSCINPPHSHPHPPFSAGLTSHRCTCAVFTVVVHVRGLSAWLPHCWLCAAQASVETR